MSMYNTVRRIQRVRDYYEAAIAYRNSVPIRGRDEEVRPLGARRDADRYQIIKVGEDYVAKLYLTHVITYKADGQIIIAPHRYNTTLTMQFISQVLGIRARVQRRHIVFGLSGESCAIAQNQELILRHAGNTKYDICNEVQHSQYVINRPAANNVRKRTANFRNYLKGFVSLRTQTLNKWGRDYDVVVANRSELVDEFGTVSVADWRGNEQKVVNFGAWEHLSNKQDKFEEFTQQSKYLEQLAMSEDSSNYYRAALILIGYASGEGRTIPAGLGLEITLAPDSLMESFDTIMFKLHSNEVLKLVTVEKGKVPQTKYDTWVDPQD